jgi:hypothetical protein
MKILNGTKLKRPQRELSVRKKLKTSKDMLL